MVHVIIMSSSKLQWDDPPSAGHSDGKSLGFQVARSELMFRCVDRQRPPKEPKIAQDRLVMGTIIGESLGDLMGDLMWDLMDSTSQTCRRF